MVKSIWFFICENILLKKEIIKILLCRNKKLNVFLCLRIDCLKVIWFIKFNVIRLEEDNIIKF